jgi:hypothetical protein
MTETPTGTLGNAAERLCIAAAAARPGGGFVPLTADEALDLATLLEHAADGWNSRDSDGLRDDALAFARTYLGEA